MFIERYHNLSIERDIVKPLWFTYRFGSSVEFQSIFLADVALAPLAIPSELC